MLQQAQLTTTHVLRTIAALKREISEIADRANAAWQELDDLEARIEQQEEMEAAA